jgi:hypothetical protein
MNQTSDIENSCDQVISSYSESNSFENSLKSLNEIKSQSFNTDSYDEAFESSQNFKKILNAKRIEFHEKDSNESLSTCSSSDLSYIPSSLSSSQHDDDLFESDENVEDELMNLSQKFKGK